MDNKPDAAIDMQYENSDYCLLPTVHLENVADGFYETDLQGNFKFFNNALCQIFGYSRAEIYNRNYRDFMDEETAQFAFESFNTIFRTGKGATDIVWEIIRKDESRTILEVSANLIIDEKGKKYGFRGIARDVTENFTAHQKLRESQACIHSMYEASRRAEKQYRALLDFLPDPVFVFNSDGTVAYVNPAFEKVFGWSLDELKGKIIPFVPDDLKEEVRQGTRLLYEKKILHNFPTRRLTKDGRLLDILLDGAIFYDEKDAPGGQIIILRDITQENRSRRINEALFNIARALPLFRRLDERLYYIIQEVKTLIGVEGASVILIDEEKKEFYFRAAKYDDFESGRRLKEVRFPLDKGVAGHVYRTGKPMIVQDTSQSPFFFRKVDDQSGYQTRNMLDVPIRTQDRMIGVLCAVNKKKGEFDQEDVNLLNTVATTVAFPIENARISEALSSSYEEVRSMNRAKERVIHHLSHELKTPLSVLDASLRLLGKKIPEDGRRILDRARRNLDRILDMQYEIEDILRQRNYRTHQMLSTLLDECSDVLETLSSEQMGEAVAARIRSHIDDLFGPRAVVSQQIHLNKFVIEKLEEIKHKFSHRKCRLITQITEVSTIYIPPDVLSKIVEGLIRNAVENTPDFGQIIINVQDTCSGSEFSIKDSGVGITEENRHLIFESNFTARETLQYSSRSPYDFYAGGKGFDLLRMKIFSERYNFNINMTTKRCRFIPKDSDICPGNVEICPFCQSEKDCLESGTTMTVRFSPVNEAKNG